MQMMTNDFDIINGIYYSGVADDWLILVVMILMMIITPPIAMTKRQW